MNTLEAAFGGWQSIVDAPLWAVLLLKVTAILAVAWVGHLVLASKNPRWRVFLWRVTAVGLVALPAASLLPSLEIQVEQPQTVASQNLPSPIGRGAGGEGRPRATEMGPEMSIPLRREPSVIPAQAGTQYPSTPRLDSRLRGNDGRRTNTSSKALALTLSQRERGLALLVAVWLAGIAVLALRLTIGHIQIRRLVARAGEPSRAVRLECARVAEAVGCRGGLKLLCSRDISSPCVCGICRPALILPARMCDDGYRNDLPAILAHEMTHVRTHDLRWNVGLQLVSILLWFHPLAWRIRHAHLSACEQVCDAASAHFVGDVTDYCRTLARVALDAHRPLATTTLAMARPATITRRLTALRKRVFHLPLRRRSVVGCCAAALLAVGVLGALRLALAEPPAAETVATADKEETPSTAKEENAAENDAAIGPALVRISAADASGKPIPEAKVKIEKRDAAILAESILLHDQQAAGDASALPGFIRVRVLDPDGKPLAGAKVHASIWTDEQGFQHNRDYTTDAAGIADVALPKSFSTIRLWASKKPFVTVWSGWEQNELASGTRLPAEYTMRLERTVTAGGQIVDEQGKPIASAKVYVRVSDSTRPTEADERTRYNIWLASRRAPVTTDAHGHWQIDNAPNNARAILSLFVSHPDYLSDETWGQLQKSAGVTTEMLRGGTATLTLNRGVIVEGRVTGPDGKPIYDAIVVHGDRPFFSWLPCKFPTSAEGRFRLPALAAGRRTLTVIAPGFAPQLRKVNLQPGLPPQDFQMEPGKPIELRFVDAGGKPVPDVSVDIIGWRGSESLQTEHNPNHPKVPDTKIPTHGDTSGVWRWNSAPDDPVKIRIFRQGCAPYEFEIAGGDPPRTVTLKPEHHISGRVTDAVTGKPIPAFTIIPINVFRPDWLSAARYDAERGRDGRLEYLATRTDIPLRLRVEAMGYRNQTGPEFRVGDDTSRVQDFPMQPSEPVTGLVLDAAGRPVTKAAVLIATPTEDVELQEDGLTNNHLVLTDADGRFQFPDPGEPFTVLAEADAGYALADFAADEHDAGTLRLKSWALARGQFHEGRRAIANATIFVEPIGIDGLDVPRVNALLQMRTDADGRFAFARVMPGPVSVQVLLGPWRDEGFRSGPVVPLDLKPGQEVELDLGRAGTVVKGKVVLTGNVPADLDCTYSLNYLISRTQGVAPPPEVAEAGLDVRNG